MWAAAFWPHHRFLLHERHWTWTRTWRKRRAYDFLATCRTLDRLGVREVMLKNVMRMLQVRRVGRMNVGNDDVLSVIGLKVKRLVNHLRTGHRRLTRLTLHDRFHIDRGFRRHQIHHTRIWIRISHRIGICVCHRVWIRHHIRIVHMIHHTTSPVYGF